MGKWVRVNDAPQHGAGSAPDLIVQVKAPVEPKDMRRASLRRSTAGRVSSFAALDSSSHRHSMRGESRRLRQSYGGSGAVGGDGGVSVDSSRSRDGLNSKTTELQRLRAVVQEQAEMIEQRDELLVKARNAIETLQVDVQLARTERLSMSVASSRAGSPERASPGRETNEHLRVQLRAAEQSQLASLQRVEELTERCDRLQQELSRSRSRAEDEFAEERHKLQAEVARLDAQVERVEAERDAALEDASESHAKLEHHAAAIEESSQMEDEVVRLRAENESLAERLATSEAARKLAMQSARELRAQLDQLMGEQSSMHADSLNVKSSVAQLERQLASATAELNLSREETTRLHAVLQAREASLLETTVELERLRASNARTQTPSPMGRVESSNTIAHHVVDRLGMVPQSEVDRLEGRLRESQRRVRELEGKTADAGHLKERLQESQRRTRELEDKVRELIHVKERLQESQRRVRELEEMSGTEAALLRETLRSRDAELARTQQQIGALAAQPMDSSAADSVRELLDAERERCAELREEVASLRATLTAATSGDSEASVRLHQLQLALATAESEKHAAVERMERREEQLEQLQSDLMDTSTKLAHAEERVRAAEERRQELDKQLAAAQDAQRERLGEAQATWQERVDRLEKDLEHAQAATSRAEDALAEKSARLENLAERATVAEQQASALREHKERLATTASEAQADLEASHKREAEAVARLTEMERLVATLEAEVESLRERNVALERRVATAKEDLAAITAHRRAAEVAQAQMRGQLETTTNVASKLEELRHRHQTALAELDALKNKEAMQANEITKLETRVQVLEDGKERLSERVSQLVHQQRLAEEQHAHELKTAQQRHAAMVTEEIRARKKLEKDVAVARASQNHIVRELEQATGRQSEEVRMLQEICVALEWLKVPGGGDMLCPSFVGLDETDQASPTEVRRAFAWARDKITSLRKIYRAFTATAEELQERWQLQYAHLNGEIERLRAEVETLESGKVRKWSNTASTMRASTRLRAAARATEWASEHEREDVLSRTVTSLSRQVQSKDHQLAELKDQFMPHRHRHARSASAVESQVGRFALDGEALEVADLGSE